MLEPTDAFLNACRTTGIAFEADDLPRLGRFLAELLETNRQFNLTAITDPDEAWMRHIFDSLTLLPFLAQAGAKTVIDVGSGGGLPAVPLAIVHRDATFTLLEATGKKARFLQRAVNELGLRNVEVVAERAETAGQDHRRFREQFDIVTARAVGRMPVLLELCVPLARVGGHVLAIKGKQATAEVAESGNALHALHAAVIDLHQTPTGTIVVIEKQRKTPRDYPRKPGEPKRAPLV